MLYLLLAFLCALPVNSEGHGVTLTDDIITPDGHSQVLAINSYEDAVAVATGEHIYLYKIRSNSLNASLVGRVRLPRDVSVKPGFLELKLLSQKEIVYCDTSSCGFCVVSQKNITCRSLSLQVDGRSYKYLTSARITYNKPKLVLRLVDNHNQAGVLLYEVENNDSSEIKVKQHAADLWYISKQVTVAGFSRGRYAYFVGSSYQPDEPVINAELQTDINITVVKITRICTTDKTPQLESRIDLALNCPTNDEIIRVGAAYYNPEQERLLVTMQGKTNLHTVCQFDMRTVDERFEYDWNTCQNTSIFDGDRDCRQEARDRSSLKDHCHIFTRIADKSQTCIKFGLSESNRFENCELDQWASTSYRYGWLEDFRPHQGIAVARVSSLPNPITTILPDVKTGAIFLVTDHGGNRDTLLRVRLYEDIPENVTSHILWRREIHPPSIHPLGMAEDDSMVIFVNGSSVGYVPITCPGLYKSCDSIAEGGFDDLLGCVWCPDEGLSMVVNGNDRFKELCKQSLRKTCPPIIDHANRDRNHSEWQVFGTHLNRLGDSAIYVCNQPCTVIRDLSTDVKLHCFLADASEQDASCEVRLTGRLEEYPSFTMRAQKTTSSIGVGTDDPERKPTQLNSKSSTKAWKAIVSVVAVVLILLALAFIIWYARKRMMPQVKRDDETGSRVVFNQQTTSLPARGNSYVDPNNAFGANSFGMEPVRSNYERLFQEIEEHIKIDVSCLRFETQIGKGHFGVVNRATYTTPDGEKRRVACKMIKEGVAGVREFITEGLTMERFNHPRVMQLIGIAFTDDKFPIIITDYMPNGDLVTYLRDKDNSPTLRQLLMFAIQIAEGMEYLHHMKFIHRDLAARNCMLDATIQVKIADFGLARECNGENMYEPSIKNRDLPLRWMAVEALQNEMFTFQGDVWSYGVVLWELMTRGMIPYGSRTGYALLEFLKQGRRLDIPPYCPIQLYNDIMLPCWAVDMEDRPTFSELVEIVKNLVQSMENSQHAELYSHYEKVSSLSSPQDTGEIGGSASNPGSNE